MPASSEVGKLRIELEAATAKFEAGLQRTNAQFRSLRRSADFVNEGFARAAKGLLAFVSVRQLGSFAKTAIDTAEAITLASEAAGLSPERFQALEYAATQSGVSIERLSAATAKFNIQLGKAQTGGAFKKTLDEAGISLENMQGGFKSTEEVLLEYSNAIANATTSSQQLKLLTEGFGKGSKDLISVFGEGAEALNYWAEEAARVGVLLSSDQLMMLDDFGDQWDRLLLRVQRTAIGVSTAAFDIADSLGADVGGTLEGQLQRVRKNIAEQEAELEKFAARQRDREAVGNELYAADFIADTLRALDLFGLMGHGLTDLKAKEATLVAQIEERGAAAEKSAQLELELQQEQIRRIEEREQAERQAEEARKLRIEERINRAREAELAEQRAYTRFQTDLRARLEEDIWQDELAEKARVINLIGEQLAAEEAAAGKLIDRSITGSELVASSADAAFGALGSAATAAFFTADFAADRFFSGLAQDIAGLIVQFSIFAALKSVFPSLFLADGGVLSSGRVLPYASGGLISKPTLFPMANGATGLAGEAGIEGIFPLKRNSKGQLGVISAGGGAGGGVLVNVSTTINHNGPQGGGTDDAATGRTVELAVQRALQKAFRAQTLEERRPGGALNPVV